jgi:hypothetical protein
MKPDKEKQESALSITTGNNAEATSSNGAVKRRKLQKVIPNDEIRCKRSDGKGWRCENKRIDGSTYCEHHHSRKTKTLAKAKAKKALSPKSALQPAKSGKQLPAKASKSDDGDDNDRVGGEMVSHIRQICRHILNCPVFIEYLGFRV